jgi:hypothetical protein
MSFITGKYIRGCAEPNSDQLIKAIYRHFKRRIVSIIFEHVHSLQNNMMQSEAKIVAGNEPKCRD